MSEPEAVAIRTLTPSDLHEVIRIQRACYGDGYLEPVEAFANKLAQAPDACWGATLGDALVAYLFSLPTRPEHLPTLHATDWVRPPKPSCLYLHDMAVCPEARSLGLATRLLQAARAHAAVMNCEALLLIAVQGSAPYWERQGFAVVPAHGDGASPLKSFGEGACLMRQNLDP